MTEHTTPVPLGVGELGPLARLLRKERRLTLGRAAEELGVTISALSRAERGEISVYRLALRSANAHLASLKVPGPSAPGRIEERIQAVGVDALQAVALLRGPETDRRASLLRQALLARSIPVEQQGRFVYIRLEQDTVSVDMPTMLVSFWKGRTDATNADTRGRGMAGFIVDFTDLADGLDAEQWALVMDRFAAALAAAAASGPLDLERLKEGVDRPLPVVPVAAAGPAPPDPAPMTN